MGAMVLTNDDIKQATGLTQSRLHRAQQRGVLKPQKAGRKGQGGAPEWSLANLGAAIIYEEWTAEGFGPELLKPLMRRFEEMEGWKTNPQRSSTGELSFNLSDFPSHIVFNAASAVESDGKPPHIPGVYDVGLARTYLTTTVGVTIGSVALFVGVGEVPESERFAKFVSIGLLHRYYADAALGLLAEAGAEIGTDESIWSDELVTFADLRAVGWYVKTGKLLRFLGISTRSADARNIIREIKKADAEEQLRSVAGEN